jgi:predicted Rossmann-fold nucleotide-binding protein
LTLIQTKKITGVKVFLIGVSYYKPLLKFIENKLYKNGMITLEDFQLIRLTDDLDEVVSELEASVLDQITILQSCGLGDTQYCKSLIDFSQSLESKEAQ